ETRPGRRCGRRRGPRRQWPGQAALPRPPLRDGGTSEAPGHGASGAMASESDGNAASASVGVLFIGGFPLVGTTAACPGRFARGSSGGALTLGPPREGRLTLGGSHRPTPAQRLEVHEDVQLTAL